MPEVRNAGRTPEVWNAGRTSEERRAESDMEIVICEVF